MALEQSIDRLSGLIEQLIAQLEAGRSAQTGALPGKSQPAATPPAEAKQASQPDAKTEVATESRSEGKSSSGATKESGTSTAPAATGKSEKPAGLDYVKDVAPRFSLLVAKDRPAAIALMRKHKADAKKLEEAVLDADGKHDQEVMAVVLNEINALLGG